MYILHSELGRKTLQIDIKNRMIAYWISIINGKQSKVPNLLYNILVHETNTGNYEHKWIKYIKDILISVGKINLFHLTSINNPQSVKVSFSRTLNDLYIQEWYAKLNASSKGKNYSIFKHEIDLERYLTTLPGNRYLPLCKFCTANHRLPIKTGRWENTLLNERLCNLYNSDIGDEFHYLFACPHFVSERKLYLKPYFYKRLNILKFSELMSTRNTTSLIMLSKFVDCIMKTFVWTFHDSKFIPQT